MDKQPHPTFTAHVTYKVNFTDVKLAAETELGLSI